MGRNDTITCAVTAGAGHVTPSTASVFRAVSKDGFAAQNDNWCEETKNGGCSGRGRNRSNGCNTCGWAQANNNDCDDCDTCNGNQRSGNKYDDNSRNSRSRSGNNRSNGCDSCGWAQANNNDCDTCNGNQRSGNKYDGNSRNSGSRSGNNRSNGCDSCGWAQANNNDCDDCDTCNGNQRSGNKYDGNSRNSGGRSGNNRSNDCDDCDTCNDCDDCNCNTRNRSGKGNGRTPAMVYEEEHHLCNLHETEEAIRKGTLFPQLYMPMNGECADACGAQLCDGQAEAFAAWEMRLYLNTHPCDKQALQLFRKFDRKAYQPNYASAFAFEEGCDDRWSWTDAPWPWEFNCNCE